MNEPKVAVITGMRAEAALLPRGVAFVCTGGRAAKAEAEARRLLTEGAQGLLSFGIAGGLDPALATGALVIGTGVVVGDAVIACDVTWAESLRVALSPSPRPSPLKGKGEEGESGETTSPLPLRERDRVRGVHTGVIVSSPDPVTYPAEKIAFHRRWHALCVDMESGAVARVCAEAQKPFAVIRAVADPASRVIPRSALSGLTESGRMNPLAVARGVLTRPGDLPGLVKLGGETRLALRALADAARRLGPALGFEPLAPFVDQ